jgi:asparagine synthase (glutamine-hydrolysing)
VVKDEHINTVAEEYFGHYLKENSASDFLDTFMDVDRETWLPDESLHRTDRMAMAHGLEVRVPLLDIDVVTYARSIPSHEKVSLFDTKIILKDAYRRRIPEWIINAPKRGWFSPAAKWLRRPEVQTFAREVLSQHYYAGTSNLFKWEGIEKMLNDHIEKKQYNLTMLWTLLAFQTWAKEYKVGL